jgi:hypothetical protein
MDSSHEAAIKAALSSARDLSTLKQARRSEAGIAANAGELRAIARSHAQAGRVLVGSWLERTGFPIDRFEDARTRNRTDLEHAVQRAKAQAVKRSASALATARAAVDAQRKAAADVDIGANPANAAAIPFRIWLDRPFLIWPTLGLEFMDWHYEPWRSFGKVTGRYENGSYEELSFYFLWENPSDTWAVIDVQTWLMAHGHLFVGADGGFFAGNRYASILASGNLYVWQWWTQPPTQLPLGPGQKQDYAYISAYGGDMFDVGEVEALDVFRTVILEGNLFLVPPHEAVVIEVALAINASIGDDSLATVDFASGDFQVACPFVMVGLLTPPPQA